MMLRLVPVALLLGTSSALAFVTGLRARVISSSQLVDEN